MLEQPYRFKLDLVIHVTDRCAQFKKNRKNFVWYELSVIIEFLRQLSTTNQKCKME